MIDKPMLDLLQCPHCGEGTLTLRRPGVETEPIVQGTLDCERCHQSYPIEAGVPDLIPSGRLADADWQVWKEHLQAFHDRLQHRRQYGSLMRKVTGRGRVHERFIEFAKVTQGRVLDIGCSSGKIRHWLDETKVSYFGLDPLPVEETAEFRYVRAVAEFIPFKTGTFTHVFVMSALDHFRDLQAFLAEIRRVLTPTGVALVQQSVHEWRNPRILVKTLAHAAKDSFEIVKSRLTGHSAPKHMAQFTRQSLRQQIATSFDVEAEQIYSVSWYTPEAVFLRLRPKGSSDAANH